MSDNKTVVVPVEPTDKQYEEGKFIAEMMLKTVGKIDISIVYQTMISAAPAASLAQQKEPVGYIINFTTKLGGMPVADKIFVWRKEEATRQVDSSLITSIVPVYERN